MKRENFLTPSSSSSLRSSLKKPLDPSEIGREESKPWVEGKDDALYEAGLETLEDPFDEVNKPGLKLSRPLVPVGELKMVEPRES